MKLSEYSELSEQDKFYQINVLIQNKQILGRKTKNWQICPKDILLLVLI